jgi:hypothetical protein
VLPVFQYLELCFILTAQIYRTHCIFDDTYNPRIDVDNCLFT